MTERGLSRSVVRDERGGATIFAAIAALVLLLIAVLIVQIGAVSATRHRAQSAADLAALAAAGTADHGSAAACAAAAEVARRMRASMRSCALDGWDAVVAVGARIQLGTFGEREVAAVARAGPADDRVH